MSTRKRIRQHCRNCLRRGSLFSGELFAHDVCRKANVGEPTTDGDVRCVCDHVEKRTRPRGCPGWESTKVAA